MAARSECRERVLVVRRHEHGGRHVGRSDGAHDLEPGHAGHLYVEEYEIGLQRSNCLDCRNAVADHADDLDAALLSHQARHALAAEGLVIDDQHAQRRVLRHCVRSGAGASCDRAGEPPRGRRRLQPRSAQVAGALHTVA